MDGASFSDDARLYVMTYASRDEHLNSFDRHLDNVLIRQRLSGDAGVVIGVEDVHDASATRRAEATSPLIEKMMQKVTGSIGSGFEC